MPRSASRPAPVASAPAPDPVLRVLYVGALREGETARHRMGALEALGHEVTGLDSEPEAARRAQRSLHRRVRRRLLGPADLAGLNRRLCEEVERRAFDVLWLDKAVTLAPATLRWVRYRRPDCRILGYSPDDMLSRRNRSRGFLRQLPHYDVFFTTKSFGVSELRALGAPRVEFVENGFDPETHRPVRVTPEERAALGGPVGFVGYAEAQRARSLESLGRAGVPVRIWGPGWERFRREARGLRVEGRGVWSRDYARTLCCFDIALCFLRRESRDLQTTRSVEIPACGVFMLAERTDEHQRLFEEGREAEFFGSDGELLDKLRHYLRHPEERREIAAAGRRRCLESGYDNASRMRGMLESALTDRRGAGPEGPE